MRMRKLKRRLVFGSIFLLSVTLLVFAMPMVMNVALKSQASAIDPEIGEINYFKADLFDYKASERSVNGNFLLGETEINNDAALILFNQENYYVKPETFGQITVPRPSEHNSWISTYKYKVAQGLVSSELGEEDSIVLAGNRTAISGTTAVKLFDSTDNATYKGSYSFPFENVGNGYLQYDSSKNHVQVTSEVGEDGLLKMDRFDGASCKGFMPFNKLNTSGGMDENGFYALSGNKNYYFGMKVEVPFVMPKDGKITTYTGESEDMVYSFSGDDDMWVYVDGELVLDLGGIHDKVSGQINFATGVVTTTGNHIDETTGKYNTQVTTVSVENTSIKNLSVGRHKLQVFYLERGGDVSNCKITFRLQEDQTPEEPEDSDGEDLVGPATREPELIPEEPEEPGESTEPGVPSVSVEPQEPGVSEDPIVSEEPQEPEVPVESTTPADPVEPDEPIASIEPEEPEDDSDKDTQPESTDGTGEVPVDPNGGNHSSTEGDDGTIGDDVGMVGGDINNPGNDEALTGDKGNGGTNVNRDEDEATEEDTNLSGSDGDVNAASDGDKESDEGDTLIDMIGDKVPQGLLPKTGTISGTIFYGVGALLIVAGVVVLVVYMKKKAQK